MLDATNQRSKNVSVSGSGKFSKSKTDLVSYEIYTIHNSYYRRRAIDLL